MKIQRLKIFQTCITSIKIDFVLPKINYKIIININYINYKINLFLENSFHSDPLNSSPLLLRPIVYPIVENRFESKTI